MVLVEELRHIGNNQAGCLTTEDGLVWHPANLLLPAADEIDRLREDMELAWGLIANAQGGDWDKASPEWREAAERWRDTAWARICNYTVAKEAEG